MVQIICPNIGWVFKYGEYEGSTQVVDPISGKTLASVTISDTVTFESQDMSTDYEAWVYLLDSNGIVISNENKLYFDMKATSQPSFFETFEVYLEDCNGVKATFGLIDSLIGKENIVELTALVKEEDFNPSFITRIGFHFKNPKAPRQFKLVINQMRFTFLESPTYCTPQEVMDFLMTTTNKGEPFKVSETSVPSYNMLAQRIVESEATIENAVRTAYTEKRVVGEVRNSDSQWPGTFGYYGILATGGLDYGQQQFFKGCPVKLTYNNIQPIDYSKGDLVEIRRFGSYWSVVPNEMIWQDETKGIIYIKSLFFQKDASVRVTYRYGHGPVPQDLKRACILKTALYVMQNEQWFIARFPQSPDFLESKAQTLNSWTWEYKDLIRSHSNTISVGGI